MTGIENFLSEESVAIHKEYLRMIKLKYSILEKSFPSIVGQEINSFNKIRLDKNIKNECIKLKADIICHELFFDSFSAKYQDSLVLKKQFSSTSAFLHKVFCIGMEKSGGFLLIYENAGIISIYAGFDFENVLLKNDVYLAVDLYEHSYFYDYRFDKERYLTNALSWLNLSKLIKT